MSRIGRQPIKIPEKVKVNIDRSSVLVEGPKGKLTFALPYGINIDIQDSTLFVKRSADTKQQKSFHGLVRAQIVNMIKGVVDGFSKALEIVGVGYRAEVKGKELVIYIGFTHPANFAIPEGIDIKTPKPTYITVSGIDKQKVGDTAARIRKIRPPEPYKGKGIRYEGEHVRRKLGKAATKAAA